MAIPRMFDSNTPFVVVTGGSELSFVAKEKGQGCDEEKDSLAQAIAPHLSRLMEHGTAKQLGAEGQNEPEAEESSYVSIIAQAEGEEAQEFSPTRTQCQYSRSQQLKKHRFHAKKTAVLINTEDEESDGNPTLPQHRLRRKHRRKSHTMRQKHQHEGEERPIIQGLWVQEIDWLSSVQDDTTLAVDIIPPPPQFTDWITDHSNHQDNSGAFQTYIPDEELASCCSGADLYGDRLEGVSLSDDLYCSNNAADSPSVDAGKESDSACHLGNEGGWECVCAQDSGSESSSRGGSSDSVCSLRNASDSFLSMCVSDSFQVRGGTSDATFDLMGVSDFTPSSCKAECDFETSTLEGMCSDSVPSLLGISDSTCSLSVVSTSLCMDSFAELPHTDTVLGGLRGRVTEMPRQFVSPFFKDLVKHTSNQRNINVPTNEGIVFHNQLQPNKHKYREGEEYRVLHHIQNGSYGDVYCVRDNRTGFLCAAKRIPLSHFGSEEVSTWSALNSPRVVELFGAVREDLNIILFMDLKPGCLAQLVRDRSSLPEDLALHYLCQLLGALEHLHLRHVLHLDIKVDNVLLSANSRDTFLCDFGLSETLDNDGQRTNAFRGSGFPGTETHMAPEVARGDQRCGKADIWSSCCMLLHMLNGCHPWIRYYAHPLCLTIANEPPPLWEVPSNCNHFTAKVLRAGLRKDPERRASARELQKKTTKALRAVGGLSRSSLKWACEKLDHGKSHNGDIPCTLSSHGVPAIPVKLGAGNCAPAMHWVSPWRTRAADEDSCDGEERVSELDQDSEAESASSAKEWNAEPKSLQDDYVAEDRDWETGSDSEVDIYMGEEECSQEREACAKNDWDYEGDWEEEEEEDCDSSSSTGYFHTLQAHFPVLRQGLQTAAHSWGSEPELEYLREGVTIGTTLQSPSPEPRDHPPSCFSCSDTSQIDASDKDSDVCSDDLSSGVFSSYNSQTEGHLEWLVISANQPSLNCLEGVDIWIENIHGECLRIRERRQVKVGHVAIGISDQISAKTFSMETLDRKMVSFQQEIRESGLWLRCVPAPDGCQRWSWRINDGRLELRE